jgi:DNA-binding NtrC family response regulator
VELPLRESAATWLFARSFDVIGILLVPGSLIILSWEAVDFMSDNQSSAGVLVVEDDWLLAHETRDALVKLGFNSVHLASDVASGREILKAHAPSLAILDVKLVGEEVFPLAEELRSRGVPFLFLTGCSPADIPGEWADYVVLPKPLYVPSLARALEKICRSAPAAGR